jgi:glycosyltransferase involved in cell wall biosynthesis
VSKSRFVDVAVVIPCFNDGHVVHEAVASAVAEGATEIVIVDDGSTDRETRARLCGLAENVPGVRIVHQENAGPGAARTRGVREVRAPYVMVLDADDLIADGALEAMRNALENDPEVAVVWGDVERFGSAGYRLYSKARSLDPWRISFVNEMVASTMVRRASILEVGGWSLARGFEDWDLWMEMAQRGLRGQHVGMTTLRYRVDDPRTYQGDLSRYGKLVDELEARHMPLIEARSANRKVSDSPLLLKWAWTFVANSRLPRSIERYLLFGALVVFDRRHRQRNGRR